MLDFSTVPQKQKHITNSQSHAVNRILN